MTLILDFDQAVVLSWNTFLFHHASWATLVKTVAVYGVYLVPLILVVWWFVTGQKQREYLLSAFLSGVVAWQVIGTILKQLVHRARPDETLAIKELLFRRPDNSFPSDHAALLSGVAFFFYLKGQKVATRWLMALALAVSLARVAMAVHYPSDIVIGFVDGFVGALIVSSLHRFLCDTVWAWLIGLARKLKLA